MKALAAPVSALLFVASACGLAQQPGASVAPAANVPRITLDQAIQSAQRNEPLFRAAVAESRALALDRTNARAALLPTASSHNQAIYTEPNGVPSSRIGQVTSAPAPIFIANNAVREYLFQGLFNETVGLQQIATIRSADAAALRAEAEAEITRRGLVATVVNLFFSVESSEAKLRAAEEARAEADRFVDLTTRREAAREVAHADVLKAHLQQQTRDRELQDAALLASRAHLELGVLVFPDPTTPFAVASDPPPPLPDLSSIEAHARAGNAEMRSALASLQLSQASTFAARAALLPDLAVNVTYGIDATTISSSQLDPDGARIHNLGYSGMATLDLPIWDWLTSERKIRQAHIREEAAHVAVTAAQRRLIANLAEFYAEAQTASHQLASLELTVHDARESLRLTNLRYVDGESTALEVVDAQNTVTSAEAALADGSLRYRLALAQLQTLTGTL